MYKFKVLYRWVPVQPLASASTQTIVPQCPQNHRSPDRLLAERDHRREWKEKGFVNHQVPPKALRQSCNQAKR